MIRIKEAEMEVIGHLLKEGALLVTDIPNTRTFYVRFREILKDKNLSSHIKGSVRDEGVYLWLYPAYPQNNLTPDIKLGAVITKWPQGGMSAEAKEKLMTQIKIAFLGVEEEEWVVKVKDMCFTPPVEKIILMKLQAVAKGEALANDEFVDFVSGSSLPLTIQQHLIDLMHEVGDELR